MDDDYYSELYTVEPVEDDLNAYEEEQVFLDREFDDADPTVQNLGS